MNVRARVLDACYAFMLPVARFLLRSGIGYKEFAEIARVAFVDVASVDYGIRGRPTNYSRISAMTGINRKEVRRLRLLERPLEGEQCLSPLADVLHRWHTHPDFLDPSGAPKTLQFQGENSFSDLVRIAAGDLPSNAVKVELIRCGAVVEVEEGLLRPTRRHLIPATAEDNLIYRLSQALRGLASTIAFNADPDRPEADRRIERVVFTDRIPDEALSRVLPIVRDRVTRFTENIDDLFALHELDFPRDPCRQIGVGVYYFQDDR